MKRLASEVLRDLEVRVARLEAVDLEYIKRLAMAMRSKPNVSGAEMKKTPSGLMAVFVYLANGETIRYEKHFGGVLVISSDTVLDIGNVNHDMMKERMLSDINRLSR